MSVEATARSVCWHATITTLILLACGCHSARNIIDDRTHAVPCSPKSCLDCSIEEMGFANEDSSYLLPDDVRTAAPRSSLREIPDKFRLLSLDEAIGIALTDTKILRSLNASAVANPLAATGQLDPAIQSTDPIFGIDAALAEFDTIASSSLTYANNDDVFNNPVLSGGASEVQQDLTTAIFGLNKTAATGTQFGINSQIQHDNTTNPSVLFPNAWTTLWEATVQQPLLQGRGVRFNRIAGPNGQPGFRFTPGVLISRINHEVTIVQFERAIGDMVNEIVNAYWQLELAYLNFDAIKSARDGSLKTWNISKARRENGLPGGEADRESQAREQYFQFEAQLLAALNGDRFNGIEGVLQAEADLRRLINLPQSDELLIRPADEAAETQTVYEWQSIADMALNNRVELQEQLYRIRQRELELEAARNFTLPRLDAIATYRNNGFGDDIFSGASTPFAGALNNALSGEYDEWEVGFAMNVPIGFRQAYAGVRNSELLLGKELAVLREQEQQIIHDLGSAIRQSDQSYENIRFTRLRKDAAQETVDARFAAYEADAVAFEELLDAQQRLLDANQAYFRASIFYELAKSQVDSEAGRLLHSFNIDLSESNSGYITDERKALLLQEAIGDHRISQSAAIR